VLYPLNSTPASSVKYNSKWALYVACDVYCGKRKYTAVITYKDAKVAAKVKTN
jgi:hypothetical protein